MAKRFLLFYKPYNVLSQFTDGADLASANLAQADGANPAMAQELPVAPGQRLTLKHYISVPGVYPVGRLDRDSEGLMLLTDHGGVQHRLSDPRYAHPRTYWVQVERIPHADALRQIRQGVVIKGYRTLPCKVVRLPETITLPPRHPPIRYRKSVPTSWLSITLREGKNRQVRRMTAAVGHPTLRLIRVSLGPLELGALQPGQWRHSTPHERQQILNC